MRKHYRILFIDDSIFEYKELHQSLSGYEVLWVPHISYVTEWGVEWFPPVDMVVSDWGGVSNNLLKDLESINHARILITSGEPRKTPGFEFCLKKDLAIYIKQRLRG